MSTPSLTVTPGKEASTLANSTPANYPNTAASFQSPAGALSSSYPNTTLASGAGQSPSGSSMAPQSGYYGNYGANTGAINNPSPSTPQVAYPMADASTPATANPYRTSNDPGYPPANNYSPNAPYSDTNAQYTASLNNSPLASRYASDPNSRFYSGPPSTAIPATPTGSYGSNVNPGATAPMTAYPAANQPAASNGPASPYTPGYNYNTPSANPANAYPPSGNSPSPANVPYYNSASNGQPSNPGNYSQAPSQYTPGASDYTPGANGYTPGQGSDSGENSQSSPYYGSGANSLNTSAQTPDAGSTPWTPGSCTSYAMPGASSTPAGNGPTSTATNNAGFYPDYGYDRSPTTTLPANSGSGTAPNGYY